MIPLLFCCRFCNGITLPPKILPDTSQVISFFPTSFHAIDQFVPIIQEDPFEQLTPREREVAELVQTGMKNLEISVKLNITETTLRVHLRRIYRKLGIQGRSNLCDFNSL